MVSYHMAMKPKRGMIFFDIKKKVDGNCEVSQRSTMAAKSLIVDSIDDAEVELGGLIKNNGWTMETVDYKDTSVPEEIRIRGFRFNKLEQLEKKFTQPIISKGAVASDYQRLRVENICSGLGLVSLAFLWKQDQTLLPQEMVAAKGQDPSKHLGKDVAPSTFRLKKKRHQGSNSSRARTPTLTLLALLLMTLCVAIATSTPVLTIKSPDGDIIDCVERAAQPAFNHPLLKNHKFQETPSNLPNMAKNEEEVSWQIWHGSGTKCPEGTIPVRRVVPHKNGTTDSEAGVEVTLGHEYAIGTMNSPPPKIYGTKVTMSVWHPIVERPDEFSLGQVWLVSGSYKTNDINTIEAGWQVYPEIYYDYQPRFFIFWTNDAYNLTKCYNLRCPGFVQTSRTILVEGAISPTSTLGGPQTEITIQIWKDPKLGLWWLGVGLNNGTVLAPVGYWPSEIFTRLADYATIVQWGGEIVNKNISGLHTRTQMGTGYLPESAKAAYMRDLEIAVNETNFQPVYDLGVGSSNLAYYRIKKFSNTSFSYGGPMHAGAVYLRSDSILLYISFSLFLFF